MDSGLKMDLRLPARLADSPAGGAERAGPAHHQHRGGHAELRTGRGARPQWRVRQSPHGVAGCHLCGDSLPDRQRPCRRVEAPLAIAIRRSRSP